ncbi:T9SS type A sorting domain-containing protein [candidate division WOR-3 bacterium]|nr:T9SS type A sorting domain-containing protein [candidate division WOR-3 bacterium]
MVVLLSIGLAQNWETSPVFTSPGDWMPVSIATDSLCLPHVAFGVSGSGVIGYASKEGDTWNYEYPDSGGAISSIGLCLDSADLPHMSFVVDRYPEPNELRYAYRDGDTWRIDALVQNATLYSLVLGRDGSPHVAFLDSCDRVVYGHRTDEWHFLEIPAYQADTLKLLGGASLAVDTNDRPGVAVTWWKGGTHDSLWLSFFEYDGQYWQRQDVDSTEGWAPWDFWSVRVRYDPASDLYHVVYRAYRYAVGKGDDWQVDWTGSMAGNVFCDFVLHQGRPHIASASPRDPVTYQWRSAGGWGTEVVQYTSAVSDPSIAVDLTGRPHVAFQWNDTLYYARRLLVGAAEPPASVQLETRLSVYPNPVQHAFMVEFTAPPTMSAVLSLTDASGRTVLSREVRVGTGHVRQRIVLPASTKAGVYFCALDDGRRRMSRKVVLTD